MRRALVEGDSRSAADCLEFPAGRAYYKQMRAGEQMKRLGTGLTLSVGLITSLPALGADYLSPRSMFGFPGTMLNPEKTFTIWFPKKPSTAHEEEKVENISVPTIWYYTFEYDPVTVFGVRDLDFSKSTADDGLKPDERYIASLRSAGMKNMTDTPEAFGTRMGHRLTYDFADGRKSVTMRMVSTGTHLYEASVVLPDDSSDKKKEDAEHFVSSLTLFDEGRE
jgi:hypothetical protein